ncbi:MAG: nitrite reductase [Spirochaetia bacterium]|nr:nitrite reductase [Spirochaetia bacterium]
MRTNKKRFNIKGHFYISIFLLISVNFNCKEQENSKILYLTHCSPCHHPERFGISAPPLIPETLKRKKDGELKEIIKDGLTATNMQPFREKLSDTDIESIINYIRQPAGDIKWDINNIRLSKNIPKKKGLKIKPVLDLMNLFMIVEGGKGLVHFMNGDNFNLLDNVYVGPIHGGPKFDKEMKYAYMGSRSGWLVKYSLEDWKDAGRIRAGVNMRNIAISPDGSLLAAANSLPENIVIIDSKTLDPIKVIEAKGKPSAVYSLKNGEAFIVCFRNNKELWFINYSDLSIEKITVDQPFSDFFIGPDERYFIGAARNAKHISIFDIQSKKIVKSIETKGMPHLASAALWKQGKKYLAAFPHIGTPFLTIVDIDTWKIEKSIKLKGSGFFARTHHNIKHIWADSNTNTIQLIDKKTMEITNEVTPDTGKKAMHIEFTKNGEYALVSLWDKDGAVVFYDTKTLTEKLRLPFIKPVGKYNATNKKY